MDQIVINPATDALLSVDEIYTFYPQREGLPGGELPVARAWETVPASAQVNRKFESIGALCVAIIDAHKRGEYGHCSWAVRWDMNPFDVIELHGHSQMLWPVHGEDETPSIEPIAELEMTVERGWIHFKKGQDPDVDSYSGFRENWGPDGTRKSTALGDLVRMHRKRRIFVKGHARDYCPLWTALDGVDEDFEVYFIWDLCAPVDPTSDDSVRQQLIDKGVHIIMADDIVVA